MTKLKKMAAQAFVTLCEWFMYGLIITLLGLLSGLIFFSVFEAGKYLFTESATGWYTSAECTVAIAIPALLVTGIIHVYNVAKVYLEDSKR